MKPTNIFHSTSIKLSLTYLLVIMIISLTFSFGIYSVSSDELSKSIRRPQGQIEQIFRKGNPELNKKFLEEQKVNIDEAKRRLKNNLILINLIILFGGGVVSYYLARLSLRPIEEAHDAQNRFTADASHELRTPITAMRAETELTLTEPKLTLKQAREQLKSNMEELDKLSELSDGLLSLARIESNGLEKSEISVNRLIEKAVKKVKPLSNKKKQKIQVEKTKNVKIQANEASLVESLVTVLENAIKYSPNNSTIIVSWSSTPRQVTIKVIDQGVGMKAVDLPHIFDRFYRADQSRTNSKTNGYGLGLSIAKSIIEAHGGKITVSSTPDKGSTFTISLPE